MTTAKPKPERTLPEPELEMVVMVVKPRTITKVAPGVTITLERDHPTSVMICRPKSLDH